MISFIIPAHNEEALLDSTLDSLAACARSLDQESEVLVVDDASTDRTADIAQEHGARVISVSHRQIAATRNAGAREASGEILIFVDADTIVNQNAVHAAIDAVRRGAVGGGCAFRFEGRVPLYGRVIEAVMIPLYRTFGFASGCFLFCTAEAFRAVGGFDETLFAAEEAAMSRALRRHGKFVVLREPVTTSGRKLRAHSPLEILGQIARILVLGNRSLRKRDGLHIWYGDRLPDPDHPRPTPSSSPSLKHPTRPQ